MREQFKSRDREIWSSASVCQRIMWNVYHDEAEERGRQLEDWKHLRQAGHNFLHSLGSKRVKCATCTGNTSFPYCNLPADQQIQRVFQQLSGYDAKVILVVNKYDGGVKKFIDTIQQLNTLREGLMTWWILINEPLLNSVFKSMSMYFRANVHLSYFNTTKNKSCETFLVHLLWSLFFHLLLFFSQNMCLWVGPHILNVVLWFQNLVLLPEPSRCRSTLESL